MQKHKEGIVIRLHVLGDFYSVGYVELEHLTTRKIHSKRIGPMLRKNHLQARALIVQSRQATWKIAPHVVYVGSLPRPLDLQPTKPC